MSFMPERNKRVKSPLSKQDYTWATKLHNAANKRGSWSETSWANEFRILRSQLPPGSADQRIEKALTWYCKNVGKEYVPIVYSAKSFRLKFDNLEAAANRQDRDAPDIEITKQAQILATRLSQMNSWSKSCKAELPLVVQVSLTNAGAFVSKLLKFRKRLQKQPYSKRIVMEGYVDRIFSNFAGGTESFVQHWIERANDRILNWEDWNGKLMSWAFREDGKTFENMGLSWSYEYSNKPHLWNQFKELINAKDF